MIRAPPTHVPGPSRSPSTTTPRMEPSAGSMLRKTPCARGGDAMDAPVPEQRGCGGAQQAAGGNGEPDVPAEPTHRRESVAVEDPGKEHRCAGEEGPGADRGRGATLGHEALIDQHPAESDDQRSNHEEIAPEVAAADGAVTGAENDEDDARRGAEKRNQPFRSRRSWAKRVAPTARMTGMVPTMSAAWLTVVEFESLELDEELNRDAEEGSDQEQRRFAP